MIEKIVWELIKYLSDMQNYEKVKDFSTDTLKLNQL